MNNTNNFLQFKTLFEMIEEGYNIENFEFSLSDNKKEEILAYDKIKKQYDKNTDVITQKLEITLELRRK